MRDPARTMWDDCAAVAMVFPPGPPVALPRRDPVPAPPSLVPAAAAAMVAGFPPYAG